AWAAIHSYASLGGIGDPARMAPRERCRPFGLTRALRVQLDRYAPTGAPRSRLAGPPAASHDTAAPRLRRRFRAVHDRVPDVRRPQRRALERGPDLSRAERRPIRRRATPDHRP